MTKSDRLESLLLTIVESVGKKTILPAITHLENSACFCFQVDGQDQGRFVGKNGAHIWAIQTLFWYAGLAQYGYSYSVRLLEPENPNRGNGQTPFRFRPDWDRDKIRKLVDEIILACTPGHAACYIREENETCATAQLKITKYLERNMIDPSFVEAFTVIMRAAGMSQGANIKTEAVFA